MEAGPYPAIEKNIANKGLWVEAGAKSRDSKKNSYQGVEGGWGQIQQHIVASSNSFSVTSR